MPNQRFLKMFKEIMKSNPKAGQPEKDKEFLEVAKKLDKLVENLKRRKKDARVS